MQQIGQYTFGSPSFDVVPDLLARAKSDLRLSGAGFDAKLTDYIRVALDLIGRYTNRILVECEVTGRFNHASQNSLSCYPAVLFTVAPVYRDAFVSLAWSVNDDEVLTGFATPYLEQGAVFLTQEPTDAGNGFASCCINSNGITEPYPIKAVIKAGYPEVDDVWTCPAPLQQAVVSLTTYFFEHPSDCGDCGCSAGPSSHGIKLPPTIALLIAPYVVRRAF